MPTYICILRGINVSGQKIIKMDALRKSFEEMKFKNVRTYIQSGNVLFESKEISNTSLEKQIQKKLLQDYGFHVPVLVKETKNLKSAVKNNSFIDRKNIDIDRLYVTFLAEKPSQTNIDKITPEQYAPDEFILSGNIVYLYCPGGYGNTKLSNNFFENKLKVVATTRNWKTVNELIRLSEL